MSRFILEMRVDATQQLFDYARHHDRIPSREPFRTPFLADPTLRGAAMNLVNHYLGPMGRWELVEPLREYFERFAFRDFQHVLPYSHSRTRTKKQGPTSRADRMEDLSRAIADHGKSVEEEDEDQDESDDDEHPTEPRTRDPGSARAQKAAKRRLLARSDSEGPRPRARPANHEFAGGRLRDLQQT